MSTENTEAAPGQIMARVAALVAAIKDGYYEAAHGIADEIAVLADAQEERLRAALKERDEAREDLDTAIRLAENAVKRNVDDKADLTQSNTRKEPDGR